MTMYLSIASCTFEGDDVMAMTIARWLDDDDKWRNRAALTRHHDIASHRHRRASRRYDDANFAKAELFWKGKNKLLRRQNYIFSKFNVHSAPYMYGSHKQ